MINAGAGLAVGDYAWLSGGTVLVRIESGVQGGVDHGIEDGTAGRKGQDRSGGKEEPEEGFAGIHASAWKIPKESAMRFQKGRRRGTCRNRGNSILVFSPRF